MATMSASSNCGIVVSAEMRELAGGEGYLRVPDGGDKLRQLFRDASMAFDAMQLDPLALRCFVGHSKDVQQFLSQNPQANLCMVYTPLRMSLVMLVILGASRAQLESGMSDHAQTLRILLTAGADAEIPNIIGMTPLHSASNMFAQPELARILLRHGVQVNPRDRYGTTPLLYAVVTDLADVADILLEFGADVDVPDADGLIPRTMRPVMPGITIVLDKWIRKRAGELPAPLERRVCDNCGLDDAPKLFRCTRCRTSQYCSVECQKVAWKANHKSRCIPLNTTSITFRPDYTSGETIARVALKRQALGIPTLDAGGGVSYSAPSLPPPPPPMKQKFPKHLTIKIQVSMDLASPVMLLAYNAKRDFCAYLDAQPELDSHKDLIKGLKLHGGKGYFYAELKSLNVLLVKTEFLASQDF